MPLLSGEIKFYKSIATYGNATNLGGAPVAFNTSGELNGTMNDIFDNVKSIESLNGGVEYRCIYVRNINNTSNTLFDVKVFESHGNTESDLSYELAWGAASINSSELSISRETISPTSIDPSIVFSACNGKSNAISLGDDLQAGNYKALWIKRTVAVNGASHTNAWLTISILGDTIA